MIGCITSLGVSDWIGLLNSIVLLCWFFYTYTKSLKDQYHNEFKGIYAGYVHPVTDVQSSLSGVVLNVINIDFNGKFSGEFDYGEVDNQTQRLTKDGKWIFFGKINWSYNRNKKRNQFDLDDNRKYKGKFFIIQRLDFEVKKEGNVDSYISAEYEIEHLRDHPTLIFKQVKASNEELLNGLPKEFVLLKSIGITFEPYQTIKSYVFKKRE